jgi:UDP-hydrolysing UDP-N-acetyl-D-glucosamine 2-epimerase
LCAPERWFWRGSKSLGFAVIEFASEFHRLRPDIVVVIGDRYEAFAATIAASYMNICIAHIQGGEVSGSIDESARHCMTKLSHYHFAATERSAEFIVRMGEDPNKVFFVGCPSGDIALRLDLALTDQVFAPGIGARIDPSQPYLLVVFHPVTTEYGQEKDEALQLIHALAELAMPTVWLWPNIDAGADHVSKAIRSYRENNDAGWMHLIKNFSPETYLKVLGNASCAIGNSSSFVRDSTFFGTPVVLVGDRQLGREIAKNVVIVSSGHEDIADAIRCQIERGRYPVSQLYGQGDASPRIAAKIAEVELYVQKRLSFI